ncbi:MAG: ribbon-helix-helix protein, CopG family [Chitinispirillaceae bacterium]|nr:ribbon-helix-helix protein, CopG family [Chitinispirillaceae bacterium]
MIRTQVYLTEDEKKGLESISILKGVSQSDLIRKAIDDLLAVNGKSNKNEIIDDIAGVWADKTDVPDVRDLRTGWRGRSSR